MTKFKMSISLDEESIAKVKSMLGTKRFRNKSHVVEFAIQQLTEESVL